MNKTNIILVGMMGSGKTTVGKILVEKLSDYKFVDCDDVIEFNEGMSIPEIFEMYSEEGFRKIEEIVIRNISKESYQVVSTGGGAFENEENRKVLLHSGKVFYLYAPSEVLYDRIKTDTHRPMLVSKNPKKNFKNLLDKRDINYRKADYIVDTSSLTPELVVKEILRRLNETVDIS